MGKIILAEGMPGTGKSRAILNLDPATTVIIKPNKKDFPFPGARKIYSEANGNVFTTKNFDTLRTLIEKINKGTKFKTIVVEDLSHYFNHRVMRDATKTGYQKWTDMAVDAFNGLLSIEDDLREDLYLIIIAHVQITQDAEGNKVVALLTPGKLLENLIQIPSYVTYVLHTEVFEADGKINYKFLTNRDGSGKEAKSPEGCLELLEDNDYAAIIAKIEAYQNGDAK